MRNDPTYHLDPSGNPSITEPLSQTRTTLERKSVVRDFIRRASPFGFWFIKWAAAVFVLVAVGLFLMRSVAWSSMDFDTFLNYFALGLLIFVFITLFYGIIAIHDVPYEIAKRRGHPQQDAIHAAGWVSLFTLHAIWPFLWIWAMLYRPDRGWGFKQAQSDSDASNADKFETLLKRIETLEARQRLEKVTNSGVEAQAAPQRR